METTTRRGRYHSFSKDDGEEEDGKKPSIWPLWQRVIMVSTAFFVSLCMSGITMNHFAFRELLLRSRSFLCQNEFDFKKGHACYENELRLSQLFLWTSISAKVLAAPFGLAMKHWGPRRCSMVGCFIYASGCIMLASSTLELDWFHYLGYAMLAAGGMCVYLPSLVMVRMLPKASTLALTFMTTTFDISAFMFVILGYFVPEDDYTIAERNISNVMAWFTIVPIISLISITLFYPDGEIPDIARRKSSDLLADRSKFKDRGIERTCSELLKSTDFWILALFTGSLSSRFTNFLATYHLSLASSGLPWQRQRNLITGLQTFLPLGGVIITGAVGQLLLSFSLATNSLIIWTVIILIWGPMVNSKDDITQSFTVVLGSLTRPCYFAILNQIYERFFGEKTLGIAYGLEMIACALINSLSIGLIRGERFIFAGQLVHYLGFIAIIMPVYLYYRGI